MVQTVVSCYEIKVVISDYFFYLCYNSAQAFLYSKNRQGFQSHQLPQYFVDDKACAWIAGFFLLYNSKDIDQFVRSLQLQMNHDYCDYSFI
jgi:hypothetical protein